MRLQFIVLATSAVSDSNGAVSALNIGADTFFSIPVAKLPPGTPFAPGAIGTQVKFSVLIRLLAKRIELDKAHDAQIAVQTDDGKKIMAAGFSLSLAPSPNLPQGWEQSILLAPEMAITPTQFGSYSVELTVDGDHKGSIPFRIIENPLLPPTTSPASS